MKKNSRITLQALALLFAAAMTTAVCAKTSTNAATKLTSEGERAMAEYATLLDGLRAGLKAKMPQIDKTLEGAFLATYEKEKGAIVTGKDKNGKPTQSLKGGNYSNPAAASASLEAAKPILASIDRFLSSDSLDAHLAKCAVLTDATPQGLAAFAQQGAAQKKLIDDLLADPKLMKEILYAGGAKAGRYGEATRILRAIEAQSPRAKEGVFRRLALATALELAAPELCGYQNIDPLKRYAFYEKSYLDKELDSHFDKHSVWLLRQVVNDPYSEEDMLWMREMLWNYRPDQILALEEYTARYVGLMYSEFGHRRAEEGETGPPYTQMQRIIDRGSICGGKAFFGRCLGRSFGIPVWGARLRSHTAMTYWTPKSWETILGVTFENGFWTVDQAEPMRGIYFLNLAYARDYPDEFVKACRAQWAGAVLGEEKVSGYDSGKGGLWNALALNAMRATVATHVPPPPPRKVLAPGEPKPREPKGFPERLVKPVVPAALKKLTIDNEGVITLPAVACASPTTNTEKIVFLTTRDGGMNLHYKRNELPEPFTYEIDVPQAGDYALSAKVVTVNREQFFLLKTDQAKQPIRMEMPYTVGKWGETEPVTISLTKGRNVLAFTRTAPEDFIKEGYRFAGPEFGGITIQSFMLKPAKEMARRKNESSSALIRIEGTIKYGDSLDEVVNKLTALDLTPVVLHTTAIQPEILQKKFKISVDQEANEQTEFYGIDMLIKNGFSIGFNREKRLVSFERSILVDDDTRGKSLHDAFKKFEHRDRNRAERSTEIQSKVLSLIEASVRLGDSKEIVVSKLKKLGLQASISKAGIYTPEQVGESGIELTETEKKNVTYYKIDMIEGAGVVFHFNFEGKLYRYQNTHHYGRDMIGKSVLDDFRWEFLWKSADLSNWRR